MLEWFTSRWERLSEGHEDEFLEKWNRLEAELGVIPEGFSWVFAAAYLRNIPVPRSVEELRDYLKAGVLGHKKFLMEDHCLQVLVNDKNFDLAYYFFDSVYVAPNPGKADFLLRQDWKLPEAAATKSSFTLEGVKLPGTATLKPAGTSEGTVYAAFLTYYDWRALTKGLPNAYVINGMRLPGLIPWLVERNNLEGEKEMRILRSVLTGPKDRLEAAFQRVAGRPLAAIGYEFGNCGLGTLEEAKEALDATESGMFGKWPLLDSRLNCTDHLTQASFHVDTWGIEGWDKYYHQWIFFDDLWAAANPTLAKGVMNFASRWDVLS